MYPSRKDRATDGGHILPTTGSGGGNNRKNMVCIGCKFGNVRVAQSRDECRVENRALEAGYKVTTQG